MKTYTLSISLIILITTFGCQKEAESETGYEASLVEVNEVLRITSENVERSVSGLILSIPNITTTDSEGFIYTSDPMQNIIFKFDNQGNFVSTIGREGRGPGEFQSVYAMTVLDDDKLYVYDFFSKQSTIFRKGGEIDQIIPMDFRNALLQIRPMSANTLILPHLQDDHVIQLFDIELQAVTESLIHADDLLLTDHRFEPNLLRAKTGSAIALSDNLIAFTPAYYNGSIYVYERSDDGWLSAVKLNGYQKFNKPFTIHETTSEPHKNAVTMGIHPDGAGYIGFELHSWSLGLFSLEDDRFAHLSYRDADENKEELELVLEIFDYNRGGLRKYAIVEQLRTTFPPERLLMWVDSAGFLYVIEDPDDPALRKIEVVW